MRVCAQLQVVWARDNFQGGTCKRTPSQHRELQEDAHPLHLQDDARGCNRTPGGVAKGRPPLACACQGGRVPPLASKEVPEPGPSLSELEAPLAGPATTRVAFGRLHLCGPAIPSQVSGDSGGAQGFRSDRAATFNGVPVPFLIIEPGERLGSKPASCAHAIMMAHEMLKGVSCGRAAIVGRDSMWACAAPSAW